MNGTRSPPSQSEFFDPRKPLFEPKNAGSKPQFGPYIVAQIRSMLQSKKITQSDFAWHEGLENWVAISSLRDFIKKTRRLIRNVLL